MKNTMKIILVMILISVLGCDGTDYDGSISIELELADAINEAKETGEIVVTREMFTPPYWTPVYMGGVAERAGLNEEDICLGAVGEEWPVTLKRSGSDISVIGHGGMSFGAVCGDTVENLRNKIINELGLIEEQQQLLKIEESCSKEKEKICILIFQ